jgi:hypothetical protein
MNTKRFLIVALSIALMVLVVQGSVSRHGLSATLETYSVVYFSNHVDLTYLANITQDGRPLEGKTVYLFFENRTSTGISNVTDSLGLCLLTYRSLSVTQKQYSFIAGMQT